MRGKEEKDLDILGDPLMQAPPWFSGHFWVEQNLLLSVLKVQVCQFFLPLVHLKVPENPSSLLLTQLVPLYTHHSPRNSTQRVLLIVGPPINLQGDICVHLREVANWEEGTVRVHVPFSTSDLPLYREKVGNFSEDPGQFIDKFENQL